MEITRKNVMTTYQSRIAGATQSKATHRRSHHRELAAFRGLSLEEIGAYTVISNQIFADEGPNIPPHDRPRLLNLIGFDAEKSDRILSKLEKAGLVSAFEGYFITLAQTLTFKRSKKI
jgi:hypothetical protein